MSNDVVQVRRWRIVGGLLIALLAGAIMGTMAMAYSGHGSGAARGVPFAVAKDTSRMPVSVSFQAGFAPIIKAALPTVVNISSSKIVRTSGITPFAPFFNDPFFHQFFGDQFGRQFQGPQEQRERSLGSGVIVSSEGYILTNNHVVDGASEIQVVLSDKRQFKAKVIGADPKTDVAVLNIDAKGLMPMPMGDSSKLEVGDFVLAIGEPFGLGGTVTMGIVSATGRASLDLNPQGYEDFIQTDAAINPGNSGGALIDVQGDLIGINTAIETQSGGSQGVGFAIPINMARQVMNQIMQHGKVVRGYLGISIQDITPDLAKAFHLAKTQGILVGDVTPGGPADHAGLKKGDVILEMNGQPLADMNHFRLQVSETPPGTTAHLKIEREGKQQDVAVKLGELPESVAQAGPGQVNQGALQGVQVEDLTPRIARQLGVPENVRGVVVTTVAPASLAAQAGLSRGDVIEEMNRRPISSVAEYESAVRGAGSSTILLLIHRDGGAMYLAIGPE